jgi:dUTP pyrophosphatase
METISVVWAKLDERAVIPTKRDEDAGLDVYAIEDRDYVLAPNHSHIFKTGLACAFSPDYWLKANERGSTGKCDISLRAGVIDSGYRGEICIDVTNVGTKSIVFSTNATSIIDDSVRNIIVYPLKKAICQLTFVPNYKVESKEVSKDELMSISSERGVGRFGSSGK